MKFNGEIQIYYFMYIHVILIWWRRKCAHRQKIICAEQIYINGNNNNLSSAIHAYFFHSIKAIVIREFLSTGNNIVRYNVQNIQTDCCRSNQKFHLIEIGILSWLHFLVLFLREKFPLQHDINCRKNILCSFRTYLFGIVDFITCSR